jgi:hypothetical protein
MDVRDNLGQWTSASICRRCWHGVIQVNDDDVPVCQCGDDDCAVSRSMRRQWEESTRGEILKDYPSAKIVLTPGLWSEKMARCWQPCGYLACPRRYYGFVDFVLPACTGGN